MGEPLGVKHFKLDLSGPFPEVEIWFNALVLGIEGKAMACCNQCQLTCQ